MTSPLSLWIGPNDRDVLTGRLPAPWADEVARDPYLRQAVLVLEVILGNGVRLRGSTELAESTAPDGSSRWIAPVLQEQPTISENYDVGEGSAPERSLAFRVPSWWIEPFGQVRDGNPIVAFGEVSLLVSGMPWEHRLVVMRGNANGGIPYGPARSRFTDRDGIADIRDSGIVAIEISDPRDTADVAFPPWLVDVERWPDAVTIGAPYPIIYGGSDVVCPKVGTGSKGQFLVAYGHGWDVTAVFREGSSVGFTQVETADELGVPVTIVQALDGTAVADTETVIARVESLTNTGPNLIDVIEDLIQDFAPDGGNLPDPELFATARARLPSMPVRTQCNTRTTLFRFIEEGILDDFPMVSMAWDSGRYGPIVTDWRAEPRMVLEVGDGLLLDRIDDPVQDHGDQLNSFVIRYGFDGVLDEFLKIQSTNAANSGVCKASESNAGPRPSPDIETIQIDDDQAAGAVQEWQVQHLALPTSFVNYSANPILRLLLRRGDTVLLTDRDHPWIQARATLEQLTYDRGRLVVGFRVWSGKYRDGRLPLS